MKFNKIIMLSIFLILTSGFVNANTLFQQQTTGVNPNNPLMYNTDYVKIGGTFLANDTYNLENLELYFDITDLAGGPTFTYKLVLYAVDGSNLPTGSALAESGTYDSTGYSDGWYNHTLTTPYGLTDTTRYGIVLESLSGTPSTQNYISWEFNDVGTENIYHSPSGGPYVSGDSSSLSTYRLYGEYATPPSDNFTVTANSNYSNNSINTFSVNIDGIDYNTTNGTITTHLLNNDTETYNITVTSSAWFTELYISHNISSTLQALLSQSEISFDCFEKITNNTLTCVNNTIYPDADTYNLTINVSGYYSIIQEETINALDNKTINIEGFYNSNLSFNNNFVTGPGNSTTSCNYTVQGITYPAYNEIITGSNGSSVGLINGTYNITADCENYAYSYETVVINDTVETVTFDLYTTNSIDIFIYDETTGLSLNGTNITVTKILGAVQEVNTTTNGQISYSELTEGNYSFNFEGDDYPQRTYDVLIGNKTYQTLNVYLLANTTDKVIFAFEEYQSNQVIEDVTLQISKVINGSDTLIAVLTSDITGRTQFYFDTTERYCFIATKTSYTTKEWCLDPIIFTSYTIKLETSISLETGDDYEEILIDWTPKQFWNNVNNNIIFTFANPQGSLTNYGFNATLDNGTTVSASGTNAYGEVINAVLPISNSQYGDKVTVYYFYKKSGDAEYRTFKLIYDIYGYNATTDSLLDNPPDDYGLGEFEKTFISVGITTLVGGAGAFFGGALAGGVMALFMFAWLMYIAFLNFWVGIISIILLFIIVAWRSSQ